MLKNSLLVCDHRLCVLLVSVFLLLILFIQMLVVMLFKVYLLRVRRNIYVTTIKHKGVDENECSKACAIIIELLLWLCGICSYLWVFIDMHVLCTALLHCSYKLEICKETLLDCRVKRKRLDFDVVCSINVLVKFLALYT